MNKLLRQVSAATLVLALSSYGALAQTPADNHADMYSGPTNPMSPVIPSGTPHTGHHVGSPASGQPPGSGMGMGMGGELGAGVSGPGGPSMMQMMNMMQTVGGMMQREAASSAVGMMSFDHIAGRIAFIKAELAITPTQEPKWDTFADALNAAATKIEPLQERILSDGLSGTMPEKLQASTALQDAQAESMHRILDTATALYDALSPTQRAAADTLMAGPQGMM